MGRLLMKVVMFIGVQLKCRCFEIRDFIEDAAQFRNDDREVFHPTVVYSEARAKRAAGEEAGTRLPVEVSFRAMGRHFHFQLETAAQPFTDMSHVLVRSGNETRIHGSLSGVDGRQDCLQRGRSSQSSHTEKVALNFCGGIRGVLTFENDYYIINPLHERNLNRVKRNAEDHASIPHVIFRKPRWKSSCPHNNNKEKGEKSYFPPRSSSYLLMDREKYFPNEIENSLNQKTVSRNYFPSNLDTEATDNWMSKIRKVEGKYFIELAIFIDRDLFKIMSENFPVDTEEHIIQVVLAMINAVQLLYNDENLDVEIQFLIKRLEILQTDPPNLERSYNIDKYLASFCKWQAAENLASDSDPLHWDHAVILTGLDVHVLDRDQVSAQVVGLAPVAGMCLPASSCTVNEGRHFESVYVMAHEIGHNLGMRHDGGEAGNSCAAGSYIMSPTLGSGKISWSRCSRAYLHRFLASSQAACLQDRGPAEVSHLALARDQLPGERWEQRVWCVVTVPAARFPADIQCRLRYGPDSFHSKQQEAGDLCRDLHCRREHYTWTSHPALEGTSCGPGRWCRQGQCVPAQPRPQAPPSAPAQGGWSSWSHAPCRAPCLYSVSGSLARGSTGLVLSSRSCSAAGSCRGKNFRFTTCNSVRQCMSVTKQSVADHARARCEAGARSGQGGLASAVLLEADNPGAACSGAAACFQHTRGWSFPDGTVCRVTGRGRDTSSFCIQGICQEFSCAAGATYSLEAGVCRDMEAAKQQEARPPGLTRDQGAASAGWSPWQPASKCSFTCLVPARGLQMMSRVCEARVCEGVDSTLGLCEDAASSCRKLVTPFQFASQTCENFRISKLSGIGMQLTSTSVDPDRACKVACQDRDFSYRFYMVSGEKGWFPYGTDCGRGIAGREAYCIKGRCLEFGPDGTPLYVPFPADNPPHHLFKRSLIFNTTGRGRVAGSIDQEYLEQIVQDFNKTINGEEAERGLGSSSSVIFDDPIDIPEPELEDITTKVFQSTSSSPWSEAETEEEFVADVDIIYQSPASPPVSGCGPSQYCTISLISLSSFSLLFFIIS